MESEETFQDYQLMSNSVTAFYEMKSKGEFCDITIKFGSHTISAHRNVVAAAIPYFREKLNNQYNETDLNEGVSDSNLNGEAMECLIEFAYTSTVRLTTENVKEFLPAASFLEIDSVADACCRFIVQRMKPEEVLSVRQYAESVSSSRLLDIVDTYACEHFDEVSGCEIFLDAPFSYVKELVCRNDLKPSKEEKVLDFVMKWIKKSPRKRKVNLVELLSKVRMGLVQPDYLTDCLEEDMFLYSIPCRNILIDARTFHFLPHRRAMVSSFETSARGPVKQRPKGNESWAPGIYALCYSREPHLPAQSLQYFNPVSQEWSVIDVFSFTLHSLSSSLLQWNGNLYFYDSDYIRAYDPPTGRCSNYSFCIGQRFNAGVTVSKNKLYICGGTAAGELSPLDTVTCFDFQKNSRTSMEKIPFRRTHLGAVSLNDELYVLGGQNESGHCTKRVWKYNEKSKQWIEVASMQYSRCAMGCAVLDGKIYVCGGITDDGVTQTAEAFDPTTKKWTSLPEMGTARFDFSLVSYDRKLYAVGGKTKDVNRKRGMFVRKVDVYYPETCKWKNSSVFPHTFEYMKACSIEQSRK